MKNNHNTSQESQVRLDDLKITLEQEASRRRKAEEQVEILTEKLNSAEGRVRNYEAKMEERIKFDMLLSEISTHFINLPPSLVDEAISEAQSLVCEILGFDVCALWQWEIGNPEELILTHLYRPLEGPPIPDRWLASEGWPWSHAQVMAGRIIALSSIENAPEEAVVDVKAWRYYGINTCLTIPLASGDGPPFGAVSFTDQQKEKRQWSDTIVKRLQLVSQIFANALSRKKFDVDLRESESRLRLATDAAELGLWDMDNQSQKVWASSKLRDVFCLAADQQLDYQDFFEKIHPDDRDMVHRAVQKSIQTCLPFSVDYRILLPDGNIRWICSRGNRQHYPANQPERVMGISINCTEMKQMEIQIREQMQEIENLRQRLENENIFLQQEIKHLSDHGEIVGKSLAMKRILAEAEQVAQTGSTVLILGETGTGKEILARVIHQMSSFNNRTMVTINCASLPPSLIESELFGREKGAYTGALTKMVGRFELADNSTLFLDEIGELPVELQGKLLRVLEDGVFERLGSTRPIHVNTRIIAATNRDIEQEVEKGRFRQDLFYRLNVFPIKIPPLRERPEDIPLLVWSFVKEFKKRMGKDIEVIPKKAMDALQSYAWPGNVRELRNVIENAMILSKNSSLMIDLPRFQTYEKNNIPNLEEMERKHIIYILKKTGWRVGGKGGAAEILGMKRPTLYSKMKKLGISRPGI